MQEPLYLYKDFRIPKSEYVSWNFLTITVFVTIYLKNFFKCILKGPILWIRKGRRKWRRRFTNFQQFFKKFYCWQSTPNPLTLPEFIPQDYSQTICSLFLLLSYVVGSDPKKKLHLHHRRAALQIILYSKIFLSSIGTMDPML